MPVRLKRRRGFLRRPAVPERDAFWELDADRDSDEWRRYWEFHGAEIEREGAERAEETKQWCARLHDEHVQFMNGQGYEWNGESWAAIDREQDNGRKKIGS